MTPEMENIRAALVDFATQGKFKVARWEQAAKLGDGTLRKFVERKTVTITPRTLQRLAVGATELLARPVTLADILGELRPDFLHFAGHGPAAAPQPGDNSRARDADFVDGMDLAAPIWPKDLPVRGASEGGLGDFQMTDEVVDHVRRAPRLAGRSDVIAVFVRTTACADRIMPGDLLVLESNRPPQQGDFALVEMRGPSPRSVYLRRWVGATDNKIRLCKPSKPADVLELDRRNILRIYRALPLADMLGA